MENTSTTLPLKHRHKNQMKSNLHQIPETLMTYFFAENCSKCNGRLFNLDEFNRRMIGFQSNFMVNLVCIDCVRLREKQQIAGDKEVAKKIKCNDDEYNEKNDFSDSDSISRMDADVLESEEDDDEYRKVVNDKLAKQNFYCTMCDELFNSLAKLQAHEYDKHKIEKHTTEFYDVQNNKNENDHFLCTICTESFDSLIKLQTHETEKHQQPEFKTEFYDVGTIDNEASIKRDEFTCDICSSVYKTLKQLRIHIRRHAYVDPNKKVVTIQKKEYKCGTCKEIFSEKTLLDNHKRSIHVKEMPSLDFACTDCDLRFKSYKRLQAHLYYKKKKKLEREQKAYQAFVKQNNGSDLLLQSNESNANGNASEIPDTLDPLNILKTFEQNQSIGMPLIEIKVLDDDDDDNNQNNDKNDTAKKFYCSYCRRPYKTQALQEAHEQYKHSNPEEPQRTPQQISQQIKQRERRERRKLLLQQYPDLKQQNPHSEPTDFYCSLCDKYYRTKRNLQSHKSHLHSASKYSTFKCRVCSDEFNRRAERHAHEYEKHFNSVTSKFPCPQCDEQFTETRSLETHLNRHADYAPFICDQCGKGFYNNDLLRSHINTHRTDINYECDQCDRQFKALSTYKRHQLYHKGLKVVYCCDYCTKQYSEPRFLKRHICAKHGIDKKPYECDVCEERFYIDSDLKRHKRVQHKYVNM